MKSSARHPRNPGRQRNECTNDRQQPSDEYRQISPATEEAIGPVEFALAHQNPASVALDQRPPAKKSDLISDQRSQIAPDRTNCCHPQQFELALKNQESRKGHD